MNRSKINPTKTFLKRAIIALFFVCCSQSCATYEEIGQDQMRPGEKYRVRLVNATKDIQIQLNATTIHHNTLYYGKNDRVYPVLRKDFAIVKRKKFSVLKTAIAAALATMAAIFIVNSLDEETRSEHLFID